MIQTVIGLSRLLLDSAKMMFPNDADINAAANVAEKAGYTYNILTNTSSVKMANRTLVSPIVAIDKAILHSSYLDTVMRVVASLDIQSVLTHIKIENAIAMGIKIDEMIGSVQPRRAGLASLQGCEAYLQKGPGAKNNAVAAPTGAANDPNAQQQVVINGKSYDFITEFTALAVGKVVNVTVTGAGDAKFDIPLIFRETPMPMAASQLLNVFKAARAEEGFFARLDMLQAKEITPAEFLTGKDIVKEKFNIRNDDMTGYYEEMNARDRANKAAALRTGVMSMNTMANTFIISSDTARQIELMIGRKFTNNSNLPAIFKAVNAARIVICNERDGMFRICTNGDFIVQEWTLKQLELTAKKSDGADSLEKLTQILMGR